MAEDPLLKWRSEFPILERKAGYLINNSLGAMPRKVYENLKAYADLWASEGVVAWSQWLPMVAETAEKVGAIVNAPGGTMIMHQNVSTLTSILISAFDFAGPKNKVVLAELNFPSVAYNWLAQQRRGGGCLQRRQVAAAGHAHVRLAALVGRLRPHALPAAVAWLVAWPVSPAVASDVTRKPLPSIGSTLLSVVPSGAPVIGIACNPSTVSAGGLGSICIATVTDINRLPLSGLTGATVTFGGTAATNVAVVNSTTITATTPAGSAGAVTVTVTNPGALSGSLVSCLTYVVVPTVSSVSPSWALSHL